MIQFQVFNEDPRAFYDVVSLNPTDVESIVSGEKKQAYGIRRDVLTLCMKNGDRHIVLGGPVEIDKIKYGQERSAGLNHFIDMLHEKMTDRKAGDEGALSDDDFLAWLEDKAQAFFPYTSVAGVVVWGTGELSLTR